MVVFKYMHGVSDSGLLQATLQVVMRPSPLSGKGEQINNDAVASKTETRIRDGMSLSDAFTKTFKEAKSRKHSYGLIGLDAKSKLWNCSSITFDIRSKRTNC